MALILDSKWLGLQLGEVYSFASEFINLKFCMVIDCCM